MDNFQNNGQPQETPGIILDQLMRKMAALQLNDYFLGSAISYPKNEVHVYFSDRTPKESLEQLRDALQSTLFRAKIEETENEGASWLLKATMAQDSEHPTEVPIDGNVQFDVNLSGKVDVS